MGSSLSRKPAFDRLLQILDEIGDVIEVEVDKFETPPDTLQCVARTLVNGAYKLDDRLMLVLHIRNAVEVANNDMMSLSA